MDFTLQELDMVKKRLSETMAALSEEEKELDDIIAYINSIDKDDLERLADSASSAKARRGKITKIKSAKEETEEYERRRAEKEANIGNMWVKIHNLQEQERELLKKL